MSETIVKYSIILGYCHIRDFRFLRLSFLMNSGAYRDRLAGLGLVLRIDGLVTPRDARVVTASTPGHATHWHGCPLTANFVSPRGDEPLCRPEIVSFVGRHLQSISGSLVRSLWFLWNGYIMPMYRIHEKRSR